MPPVTRSQSRAYSVKTEETEIVVKLEEIKLEPTDVVVTTSPPESPTTAQVGPAISNLKAILECADQSQFYRTEVVEEPPPVYCDYRVLGSYTNRHGNLAENRFYPTIRGSRSSYHYDNLDKSQYDAYPDGVDIYTDPRGGFHVRKMTADGRTPWMDVCSPPRIPGRNPEGTSWQ